jgi:ABC-type multidrug transport system fused ATPase/permease subunit
MKMAFSNGCEIMKLIVALLGAAVNGAVLPVFAYIFTDLIDVFFYCTEIPFNMSYCALNSTFYTDVLFFNDTNNVIRYGCSPSDLLLLADPEVTWQQCNNAYDNCAHDNLASCEDDLMQKASLFSLYFVIIGIAGFVGVFFQQYLFGDVGATLTRRIREASFKGLLKQHIGYFDKKENATGSITTKLSQDASAIEAAVGKNLGTLIQNVVTVCVGIGMALSEGWEITLFTVALLPLLIIGSVLEMRSYLTIAKESSKKEARAGQVISESVRGIRTVSSFGIQPNLLKLYDSLMRSNYDSAFSTSACEGASYGYSQAAMYFVYTGVFFFAAFLMRKEIRDPSQIMKVFFVLLMSGFSIGQAVGLNTQAAKGQKSIPSIFAMIDAQSEIDPTESKGTEISGSLEFKGHIEFKNVKFAYPEREGLVLKGISFEVKSGQTVALVGSSGSGKSTVMALLERFYDLAEGHGQILLDGKPITDYNIRYLRRILGQVEQEPRLFGTTIKKNILYGQGAAADPENVLKDDNAATLDASKGNVEPDLEQSSEDAEMNRAIDDALKAAHAYNFVHALPDNVDTDVGEQGKGQLSGGQKQRIAIARALMRDAPVMLLDEATSALDSESEKLVQDALQKIMAERTCLVIAHRLSTIQDADVIFVLDEGLIVEQGNHQELLDQDGVYANLCLEQSMATA